jgi:processive 1,2-diacylglycerol beta-glucosyltransferase
VLGLKTILILTAGFGEGHNSAARNLRDALLHAGGAAVSVKVLDLYALAYGRANHLARRQYLRVINSAPRLWLAVYRLMDRPGWFERTLFLQSRLKRLLARTLAVKQPAAVCCTYPGYSFLLGELRREGRVPDFFHATLVTDSISINSVWYRAGSDAFIVPNQASAEVLAQRGVPAAQLHDLGFPVSPAFAPDEPRPPLPAPSAVGGIRVLYIIDSGRRAAPAVVAKLLAIPGITLTVTTGRDERLREILRRVAADSGRRVEILGWTDRIPALLLTHHLVITKAGGAITQEAVAAACPVIFSRLVPGQEEGNWELLRRAGAGLLAAGPREIPGLVAGVFRDDARRWRELRANIKKISRPDAALAAARFLLSKAC